MNRKKINKANLQGIGNDEDILKNICVFVNSQNSKEPGDSKNW